MSAGFCAEIERARREWGANCGPCALAAVLHADIQYLRPHLGDFERKHYTSPSLMLSILRGIGEPFFARRGDLGRGGWPVYGLARIQWEGPWTAAGVPARVAYVHTHWVGVNARSRQNVGIFDVNAIGNGSGWCALSDWRDIVVPMILAECEPKSNGGWHLTHAIEITSERFVI